MNLRVLFLILGSLVLGLLVACPDEGDDDSSTPPDDDDDDDTSVTPARTPSHRRVGKSRPSTWTAPARTPCPRSSPVTTGWVTTAGSWRT